MKKIISALLIFSTSTISLAANIKCPQGTKKVLDCVASLQPGDLANLVDKVVICHDSDTDEHGLYLTSPGKTKPEGGIVEYIVRPGATAYSFKAGQVKFSLEHLFVRHELNGKFSLYFPNGEIARVSMMCKSK